MKNILSYVFIFMAIFFVACEKKSAPAPIPSGCILNKSDLSKKYQIKKIEIISDDRIPLIPEICMTDNTMSLDTSGTYVLNDVGIQCTPLASEKGNWKFENSVLYIGSKEYSILNFDCENLVLYRLFSQEGYSYKETTTLEIID